MDNVYNLIDEINQKMIDFVVNMEQIEASDVGLDPRCGYININEDCIIVPLFSDRVLQYYGGFEYVSKEYRQPMGEYVIYLGEDDRVRGYISNHYCDKDKDV